ncbi:MAG: outer membrane beta-barrel protein [Verrucomicrobiota bacterium]|nr:outer membrane beta-barrel protein [Verrucomicrobiota bacterium]
MPLALKISRLTFLQRARCAAILSIVAITLPAQITQLGAETVLDSGAASSASDTAPRAEISGGDAVSAVPKRFQYAFRLNGRAVYDDNIYLRQFDKVDDYFLTVEPGVTIGFGDIVGHDMNSIRLDYAPSFFFYADHPQSNAIQQIIRLDGQYRLGHLSLGLSQDVQLLEGANPSSTTFTTGTTPTLNIDTNGNTQVNIYSTTLTASYDLTGKTFLSGGLHFTAYDYYQSLISSESIDGNLFINYIYSPKLTVGLGGTFGYNWVASTNPDQTFEQVNLRLNYQATGKVSLDGSVGVEFRQFQDTANNQSDGTYVSPVYELGATYQPFDGTTVSLHGSRRTQNSAVFAGQDYSTTDINLSVRQRFLQRIYLGISAGYQHSDYFSTSQLVSATRTDNYFYLQPTLDFTLTRFWTMGAYYLHREDDSSANAFRFDDNQYGLRTSFTF